VRSVCCISFVALAATTLACGSSTAPPALTAAQLVEHFTALAGAECTPAHPVALCNFAYAVTVGPAEGVVPTRVHITTSAGAGDWYAFIIRTFSNPVSPVDPNLVDTSYEFVAYDNLSLQHVVIVDLPRPTNRFALLLADTTMWASYDYDSLSGSVSATTSTIGAPCIYEGGPQVSSIQECRLAQFQVSMDITMQPQPGSPLPPRTIVMSPQTVVGWVEVDTTANQRVSSSSTARRANKSAISMAARAASAPLLPCSPPARASACSIVSHVSNPNPTGV